MNTLTETRTGGWDENVDVDGGRYYPDDNTFARRSADNAREKSRRFHQDDGNPCTTVVDPSLRGCNSSMSQFPSTVLPEGCFDVFPIRKKRCRRGKASVLRRKLKRQKKVSNHIVRTGGPIILILEPEETVVKNRAADTGTLIIYAENSAYVFFLLPIFFNK